MHHCKWTLSLVRRFSDWTALVVEVSFETLKVEEENVRKNLVVMLHKQFLRKWVFMRKGKKGVDSDHYLKKVLLLCSSH